MATIETRVSDDGKTRYRVRIRLKGYPEQTATFERKTDAKKWAQQVRKSAEDQKRHLSGVICLLISPLRLFSSTGITFAGNYAAGQTPLWGTVNLYMAALSHVSTVAIKEGIG